MKDKTPVDIYSRSDNHILAIASLFEGDFSIDWLLEMDESKASQILSAMEKGIEQGLLTREGPGRFRFKDSEKLKRLRRSLTVKDRKRLHRQIANILTREVSEDAGSVLTVAGHLIQISNDVDGCRLLLRAANLYRNNYHYSEALEYYEKAIKDLRSINSRESDNLFAEGAIEYSKISYAAPDIKAVISALKVAVKRTQKRKDKAHQALLEMQLAKNEFYCSNFNSAFRHFDIGWSMAQNVDDQRLRRSSTTFSAFFLYCKGRYGDVVRNYEEFVPDIESYPKGEFTYLAAWVIGVCYGFTGRLTRGIGMLNSIYNHCMNKSDSNNASMAALGIGVLLLYIGRIDEALRYLEDAIKRGSEVPNNMTVLSTLHYLVVAYYKKGYIKKAGDCLNQFLLKKRNIEMPRAFFPYLIEICWLIEQGELPQSKGLSLENEIDRAMKSRSISIKGLACRYQALLQKRSGESPVNVIRSLMQSIKFLEESGNQFELTNSRIELARQYLLWNKKKKAEEIIKLVAKNSDILEAGMVPEELRFLLEDLRTDRNLVKEIMRLGQELVTIRDSRELVRRIISTVNHITGAERSAIFLIEKQNSSAKPTLRAAQNLTEEDIAQPGFKDSMEMIQESATIGKGRVFTRDSTKKLDSLSDNSVRGCICVPMKLRDTVLGVLYLDNRFFRSTFKESDLEILNYFAAQAAIAMDNAMAYENITILNKKLREEKDYYEEQHCEILHFDEFVGKSPAIKEVLSKVDQVADMDTNVLILGETGVGKELVARAIHNHSSRKNKPFVRVVCNAFPETLIASELFGHEKGAFTGATALRIGRFELADGGTLFLDEIGEIDVNIQVRLLRVLHNKEFERLGGKETLRSDFRLIAATNRDLFQDVKAKRFREDLYYRLNVFPIHVAPLRKRKEDIPLLAQYFLDIHAGKAGKPINKISKTDMEKLIGYNWPGNVRELENIIERGVILSLRSRFTMPELIREHQGRDGNKKATTLEENERQHILWALEVTGGTIRGKGGASELLNINPSTLYHRMRKLEIHKTTAYKRN
ncbi:MAG: sigma 54-interacting transcriptional regulator [Deltaproteobacteria bacterium]|nr:sigma 54-interacting transcriptional regulator [Deltaproteobacteria bacterium]